jgi:hypothetical protein
MLVIPTLITSTSSIWPLNVRLPFHPLYRQKVAFLNVILLRLLVEDQKLRSTSLSKFMRPNSTFPFLHQKQNIWAPRQPWYETFRIFHMTSKIIILRF